MYLKLKEGILKYLTNEAFRKAGNIYKLSKEIKISKSTLSHYHCENRLVNDKNLRKIENYLKIKVEKRDLIQALPDNWKQILGGKNRVKKAKENGTFEKQLKKAWLGAKGNKKWHDLMKKTDPEKYYKSQYEKFKKIGEYKFSTINGEKVRNELEKSIADILKRQGVKYQYEPYINIKDRAFFPDFVINDNIIIECTAWRGYDKAIKLKRKIKYLKNKYNIYVVIPKALNNYYKILNNHLVLGLDEFVPLAQTFRSAN